MSSHRPSVIIVIATQLLKFQSSYISNLYILCLGHREERNQSEQTERELSGSGHDRDDTERSEQWSTQTSAHLVLHDRCELGQQVTFVSDSMEVGQYK